MWIKIKNNAGAEIVINFNSVSEIHSTENIIMIDYIGGESRAITKGDKEWEYKEEKFGKIKTYLGSKSDDEVGG